MHPPKNTTIQQLFGVFIHKIWEGDHLFIRLYLYDFVSWVSMNYISKDKFRIGTHGGPMILNDRETVGMRIHKRGFSGIHCKQNRA